jgi:acid phosphatase class B
VRKDEMVCFMKKLTATLIAAVALCAVALPSTAAAAKPINYKGKTSSGHKVTFKLKGKQVTKFVTGAPVTCIPIQGTGTNFVGAEPIVLWFGINKTEEFTAELKPAFYYNEVTMNFRVKTKKFRNGAVKGSLRWQYEFLIPKYPIGTFTIYSCLGEATWNAKPTR